MRNATVLTRFSGEELTLKQLLTMKSVYCVCRAQNYVFSNTKGVESSIAKNSSLQLVLNVSF